MSYAVAQLDQVEEIPNRDECRLRPLRHHFGITAFGVNAWVGHAAGDRIVPEHEEDEGGQEELYLVLRGHAAFELDGERFDAPQGTLFFVRPGVKRTALAEEAETTVLVLGGNPGRPHDLGGWEFWNQLDPLYRAGEYDEAADRGRELVERHPQYPALFYNVACCESLAGRSAEAIEHLRPALAGSEDLRELAKSDTDLDPLRDEPAFRELVGT